MKTFGDTKLVHWGDHDGKNHVLVATRGAGWHFFCATRPEHYETVEVDAKQTTEPTVWLHDREQVTCPLCLALLDGETIEWVKVVK